MLHENKEFKEPKLLHLDLETSSHCNFNCSFCPRPLTNGQMELPDIFRIIKEFADQGGETIKPFWRGEPFADKRMPEILKHAKECGLKTMINTNGSDPLGIYIDCLPYIDWISFSIDEQHDNINNKTADRILKAYDYVYLRENIEIQASQYNAFICFFADNFNINYKVDPPTKRSDTDNESEVITGERKYCGFPDWRLIVAWNGDCTICCVDWDMQNLVGNVYKNSLTEIFNGRAMQEFRDYMKDNIFATDICKHCPSRSAYV